MSSASNDHSTTNKSLLSKMFGNKLNPTVDFPAADDSASAMSGATLVQEQPLKSASMSKEEKASLSDLMAKANTMPPEEFKAYLARYKEEADAAERERSSAKSGEYTRVGIRTW